MQTLEQRADEYASHIAVTQRFYGNIYHGGREFATITELARAAYLDGLRQAGISLRLLQQTNVERAGRWHPKGLAEWSPLEWAGAMAGEAGEACNAAKKLKRMTGNTQNIDLRGAHSAAAYRKTIAKEVADTVIYGVLLIAAVGEDAEATVREVFNAKSIEYGFPERL
jgi:NTP pyrophosphatase (non-canonical NTP hydrolase)